MTDKQKHLDDVKARLADIREALKDDKYGSIKHFDSTGFDTFGTQPLEQKVVTFTELTTRLYDYIITYTDSIHITLLPALGTTVCQIKVRYKDNNDDRYILLYATNPSLIREWWQRLDGEHVLLDSSSILPNMKSTLAIDIFKEWYEQRTPKISSWHGTGTPIKAVTTWTREHKLIVISLIVGAIIAVIAAFIPIWFGNNQPNIVIQPTIQPAIFPQPASQPTSATKP